MTILAVYYSFTACKEVDKDPSLFEYSYNDGKVTVGGKFDGRRFVPVEVVVEKDGQVISNKLTLRGNRLKNIPLTF